MNGERHRKYTSLPDTPTNRAKLRRALEEIEAQEPTDARPRAPSAAPASAQTRELPAPIDAATPVFAKFAEQWVQEHVVEWRRSHLRTLRCTLQGDALSRMVHNRLPDAEARSVEEFQDPSAIAKWIADSAFRTS